MSTRIVKPSNNGNRNVIFSDFSEITSTKRYKNLLSIKPSKAGRNNQGIITIRHRGAGNKQFYRSVDFNRDKFNVPGIVESIQYDPNRTARIAVIKYADGDRRYILAPLGINIGEEVISAPDSIEIKIGNSLKLSAIPVGTIIHNIELQPGRGAELVRSAGALAQLMAKELDYAVIRLPSGELRRVSANCMATIGQVSNIEHRNIRRGKAGKSRHLGIRPIVRGSAMNPCDHPHGGGEGKCPIGHPGPVSPQGKPTRGVITRDKKKASGKLIISRRTK